MITGGNPNKVLVTQQWHLREPMGCTTRNRKISSWAGRGRMIVKALSEAVRIKSLGRGPLCFGAYGVQLFTNSRVVQ